MNKYFKDNIMHSIDRLLHDNDFYNSLVIEGIIFQSLKYIDDVETLKNIISETVEAIIETREEKLYKERATL